MLISDEESIADSDEAHNDDVTSPVTDTSGNKE